MTKSPSFHRLVLYPLIGLTLTPALLVALAGCSSSPLAERSEQDLRDSVVQAIRQELRDAEQNPQQRFTEREEYSRQLPIEEQFLEEGRAMAGPASYSPEDSRIEKDLLGRRPDVVHISLEHAIRTAVDKNLAIQFARLEPAIAEAQVVQAEAAFDWVFTSNLTWSNLDRVSPGQSTGGFNATRTEQQSNSVSSTSGLRRALTTGGQLSVEQQLVYTDADSPTQTFTPNPATSLSLTATLDQPLLRNFGSDVSLAQVRINRNLERTAIAQLRVDLNQLVHNVETAYWDVYQSQRNLMILRRLLDRGVEVSRQLEIRKQQGLDVDQAQLSDAVARVQARRSNVVTAEIALRRNSDRLKQLINDPNLSVGSEVMLIPADVPVDETVQYSLLDSITTAVAQRPEVLQSILAIDNSSIQQIVANNRRLPQLDLRTQLGLNGLDDDLSVYGETLEGNFVDYVVGLVFEQPIGNREAEAVARQRRLERNQAVISYRNTVQNIVREVKDALDSVRLNYTLVDQTAAARISAAESLRSLEVQLDFIQGRTALQLDQLLTRQERVANAEQTEIQALSDFNRSVSDLYRATGTILTRNRVELVIPDASDEIRPWYGTREIPETASAPLQQSGLASDPTVRQ
jgi:outer membrane protein